jgi:nucleoside-diphosphate-sugar epimerase
MQKDSNGVVFVTGAMGHVGTELAWHLQKNGMNVRALVRTDAQETSARGRGFAPVRGDLSKPESFEATLAGSDFVLHIAATGSSDYETARIVNVEGTRHLAELALKSAVKRFVHISTISVHGDPLPELVDEDSALATNDPQPYCATKALAEIALNEVRDRGLETVILRPGMICNVLRSQWGNEMVERIRNRGWLPDLHPDDAMPWVHTSNLAEMAWLSLTHPQAANETFLAVDRNVAMREFFVPIAEALGQKVITPDRAPIPTKCKLGKLQSVLGYEPIHSFEETIEVLIQMARVSRA